MSNLEISTGSSVTVEFSLLVPLYNVDLSGDMGRVLKYEFPLASAEGDMVLESFCISLFRWEPGNPEALSALDLYASVTDLPKEFAFFDKFPQRTATVILVVQTKERYLASPHLSILLQLGNSRYIDTVVKAFVTGLKLSNDAEPHVYKGFYFKNRHSTGLVYHWPIKEMQGLPLHMDAATLNNMLTLFRGILVLESTHHQSTGHRVAKLAQRYYILSSTQTEFDVIFMFLMIAFEAMFKRKEEESVSSARRRFCKLVAERKSDYSKLSDFMSEDPAKKGCCYLCNAIVHGDEASSSVGSQRFWELKKHLRVAMVRLIFAIKDSKIDRDNYYDSLDWYVEDRFVGLV